jgi:hypothetical protein
MGGILHAIGGGLDSLLGKGTTDKLPVLGPLMGSHQEQQDKQAAMQKAIDMYTQQRQATPGLYHQNLQNQLNAYQPVNHLLTEMYGPAAYQKLDYGGGRHMSVQQPALNLQAPPDPFAAQLDAEAKANPPATAQDALDKVKAGLPLPGAIKKILPY